MEEIKEYLKELEFDVYEDNFVLPQLNDASKRFRELARIKHSDKGGDDEEFIKIYNAYKQIKKFYEKMKGGDLQKYCEGNEEEEELIKNLFEEFNYSRKNKSSFTIFIENDLSLIWNEVLENRYGGPEDKGVNGLHWSHKDYEFNELEKSDIYLRKYHKPKSDNTSKIVIQGNFELAVAFVANELPKLYKKVHDKKIMTIAEDTRACEICPYKTAVLTEFEDHVKSYHKKDQIDVIVATQSSIKCSRCEIELLLWLT